MRKQFSSMSALWQRHWISGGYNVHDGCGGAKSYELVTKSSSAAPELAHGRAQLLRLTLLLLPLRNLNPFSSGA